MLEKIQVLREEASKLFTSLSSSKIRRMRIEDDRVFFEFEPMSPNSLKELLMSLGYTQELKHVDVFANIVYTSLKFKKAVDGMNVVAKFSFSSKMNSERPAQVRGLTLAVEP